MGIGEEGGKPIAAKKDFYQYWLFLFLVSCFPLFTPICFFIGFRSFWLFLFYNRKKETKWTKKKKTKKKENGEKGKRNKKAKSNFWALLHLRLTIPR